MNIESIPISALELPSRANHAFARAGIATVGGIERLSDSDLEGMEGIGIGTALAVRRVVSDFRLKQHAPWGLALELPPEVLRILQFIADTGPLGASPSEVAAYLVTRGLDDMMRAGVLPLETTTAGK